MPAQEDFLPRFALHALPELKGSFRSPLRNLGGNHNMRQVARRVRHLHVRDSPYCPRVLAIRSLYVMLDIRDHGSDGGQTAGLAERQGENAPFQCRGSGRGRIPAAQIAERRDLGLPHSRPMPSIGSQCHELRINDENQTWRIVYHVATDAVVILDVFSKKTAAMPSEVLTNCKRRLAAYFRVASGGERKRK